jgi:flavin reductase (DIM6/NTAB) family NADH-FMN oxidoreductase RutF
MDNVQNMNNTSVDYPFDADEFEKVGVNSRPATLVKPSLVADSPVNLECKLHEIYSFGDQPGAGQVIFGRVLAVHVDDSVLAKDGLVDPVLLKAVGRMGRSSYSNATKVFDVARPELKS